MGRILAIDYGKKRTGLAVTDPQQLIASPLDSLLTAGLESYLSGYLAKEAVELIVVGYPVDMNNKPSESIKYLNPFLKKLGKLFPEIPVRLFDERFTSKIAFRAMIDGGVKKSDRRNKGMIDRISATVILQSYLERRAFLKEKEQLT